MQFCLLHSLNNLFQVIHFLLFSHQSNFILSTRCPEESPIIGNLVKYAIESFANCNSQEKDAFTRESLNSIAEKLVADDPNKQTWTPLFFLLKPHHNTLTGNYDVNVMIAALEGKGKSVAWHDKRNGASSIGLDADALMGIVLNVPVRRYGGLWRGRHWVVMRKIDGVWYNLDSDLAVPHPFKDDDEVWGFLDQNLASGAEILLVNSA